MTLETVAELLRLKEKAIAKMAEAGEIPAVKVSRQWRFNRRDISAWVAGRNLSPAIQRRLPPEATGGPRPLTVAGALSARRVKLDLTAQDKDGILHELGALVIDPKKDKRLSETLFKALKAREELCSTSVGDGVAIPHSRNALVGLVETPVIAYGRSRSGVQFGAVDGKPVHHFFLLCAPNVREHLQLLARLARLSNEPEVRAKLLAAEGADQILTTLQAAEHVLIG